MSRACPCFFISRFWLDGIWDCIDGINSLLKGLE
uniref:Uncharacterized protein n=1 Tax=Arundo donax TaxID=35708 RepID=A0A0A9BGA6_ARUDO